MRRALWLCALLGLAALAVADGETAALLEEAAVDILAHRAFPLEHRRQLHNTNPLERVNKEIRHRSPVVGIFPNRAALLRLVGAVLAEQDDEWVVADRRYFRVASMRLLTQPPVLPGQEELLAAVCRSTSGSCEFPPAPPQTPPLDGA